MINMNQKIVDKLNNATLSKSEFKSLLYLERKIYQQTANERFTKLDFHLDSKHVDWKLRIQANKDFALCVRHYIRKNLSDLKKVEEIKIIELGASLGAITTMFVLKELSKYDLLKKSKIWLLDVNKEGLLRTKKLNFNLSLLLKYIGFKKNSDIEILKKKLKSANIIKGDILKLLKNLPKFDFIISGFIHHHLNIFDKKIACKEMEKLTKKKGFIGIGDLYFNYIQFIKWLKKHKKEVNKKGQRIPYAIESFIPIQKHVSFFKSSKLQFQSVKNCYYVFYLEG